MLPGTIDNASEGPQIKYLHEIAAIEDEWWAGSWHNYSSTGRMIIRSAGFSLGISASTTPMVSSFLAPSFCGRAHRGPAPAAMTDYLSQLPFEIKSSICSLLVDASKPTTRHLSLANLRLTCRAWSDAPLTQLFHTVNTPIWGQRGLPALYALSRRPDLARHVRMLKVRACIYEDDLIEDFLNCSHEQKGQIKLDLFDKRDIFIPRCPDCYFPSEIRTQVQEAVTSIPLTEMTPAPLMRLQGRSLLAELWRHIFSALPKTSNIDLEVLSPLSCIVTHDQLEWASWGDFSSQMVDAVLCGFFSSTSPATLDVGAPAYIYRHIFPVPEHPFRFLPDHIPPPEFSESSLTTPSNLRRVRFHSTELQTMSYAHSILAYKKANFAYLCSLDVGRFPETTPLDKSPRYHYPLFDFRDRHPHFPRLTRLVLRAIYLRDPKHLGLFCQLHTPNLTSLSLGGDGTTLSDGGWSQVFQDLRDRPFKLTRFRLLGSCLLSDEGGDWHIRPYYDLRPGSVGDSVEFDALERYVLGEEMVAPWPESANYPGGWVVVWNARREGDGEGL